MRLVVSDSDGGSAVATDCESSDQHQQQQFQQKKSRRKKKQELVLSAEVVDSDSELDAKFVPRPVPPPASGTDSEQQASDATASICQPEQQQQQLEQRTRQKKKTKIKQSQLTSKQRVELKLETARLQRMAIVELEPKVERKTFQELFRQLRADAAPPPPSPPQKVVVESKPRLNYASLRSKLAHADRYDDGDDDAELVLLTSPRGERAAPAFNPVKWLRKNEVSTTVVSSDKPQLKALSFSEQMALARQADAQYRPATAVEVVQQQPTVAKEDVTELPLVLNDSDEDVEYAEDNADQLGTESEAELTTDDSSLSGRGESEVESHNDAQEGGDGDDDDDDVDNYNDDVEMELMPLQLVENGSAVEATQAGPERPNLLMEMLAKMQADDSSDDDKDDDLPTTEQQFEVDVAPAVQVHRGRILDSDDEPDDDEDVQEPQVTMAKQIGRTDFVDNEAEIEDDEYMHAGGLDGDRAELDKVLAEELADFVAQEPLEKYAEADDRVMELYQEHAKLQDLDDLKGAARVMAGKMRGRTRAVQEIDDQQKFGRSDVDDMDVADLDEVADVGEFEGVISRILGQYADKQRTLLNKRQRVFGGDGAGGIDSSTIASGAFVFRDSQDSHDDDWAGTGDLIHGGHVHIGDGEIIDTDVDQLEEKAKRRAVLKQLDQEAQQSRDPLASMSIDAKQAQILGRIKSTVVAQQVQQPSNQPKPDEKYRRLLSNNATRSSLLHQDENSRDAELARYKSVFSVSVQEMKQGIGGGVGSIVPPTSKSNWQGQKKMVGFRVGGSGGGGDLAPKVSMRDALRKANLTDGKHL